MRQIIVAVIFISAAIGVFWGWTMPMIGKMQAMQKDIADLEGVLARFYDLRQIKNDLTSTYNSIGTEDFTRLQELSPSSIKESDLIVEFEGVAAGSGMLLKRIDIKPAVKEEKSIKAAAPASADVIAITLQVDGSYSALKNFLHQVESSLRIINVRTLSFLSGDKDFYEFNVTAEAYFKK